MTIDSCGIMLLRQMTEDSRSRAHGDRAQLMATPGPENYKELLLFLATAGVIVPLFGLAAWLPRASKALACRWRPSNWLFFGAAKRSHGSRAGVGALDRDPACSVISHC